MWFYLKGQEGLEVGDAIFERKIEAENAQIYFFFRATSMLSIPYKGIAITNLLFSDLLLT